MEKEKILDLDLNYIKDRLYLRYLYLNKDLNDIYPNTKIDENKILEIGSLEKQKVVKLDEFYELYSEQQDNNIWLKLKVNNIQEDQFEKILIIQDIK